MCCKQLLRPLAKRPCPPAPRLCVCCKQLLQPLAKRPSLWSNARESPMPPRPQKGMPGAERDTALPGQKAPERRNA